MRAKWDVVKGAWPALWLIPVQDAAGQALYAGVRNTGELDIFEGSGAAPHTYFGTLLGSSEIQHTDWGLLSSSTVGIRYMGRSFGCIDEPFMEVRPSFMLTPMRRCLASCPPGWLMLRSAGEWS